MRSIGSYVELKDGAEADAAVGRALSWRTGAAVHARGAARRSSPTAPAASVLLGDRIKKALDTIESLELANIRELVSVPTLG